MMSRNIFYKFFRGRFSLLYFDFDLCDIDSSLKMLKKLEKFTDDCIKNIFYAETHKKALWSDDEILCSKKFF